MQTPQKITIHVDKQAIKTSAAALTGSEIRALHKPAIGPDRSLFLTVPGPGDDQQIGDSESVRLTEGVHFFSVVSQITPGGAAAPPEGPRDATGVLLDSDVQWLKRKGFSWQVTADPNGGGLLVIANFPINAARYDRDVVDLLLVIPKGYNDSPLDMWWVSPFIRLRSTGGYPAAADVPQLFLGRTWQRFSRHLTQPWRAGVDDVRGFMIYVTKELQGDA